MAAAPTPRAASAAGDRPGSPEVVRRRAPPPPRVALPEGTAPCSSANALAARSATAADHRRKEPVLVLESAAIKSSRGCRRRKSANGAREQSPPTASTCHRPQEPVALCPSTERAAPQIRRESDDRHGTRRQTGPTVAPRQHKPTAPR